jgi:hypothetical protein
MSETRTCPECGASLAEASTCEELFHRALAMEWNDPPHTSTAHHLLVLTYLVQHPAAFTGEGRAAFIASLISAIDGELSGAELLALNRRLLAEPRSWRFRLPEAGLPHLRRWALTIADVIGGPAGELPQRVWRWARHVRQELHER